MTCWSAAATMVLGPMCVGPGNARLGKSGGLVGTDANVETFARSHGLQLHYPQCWTVEGLASVMQYGPIWVTGLVPGLHAFVIAELHGDGTPMGTELTIYDPWPPGVGSVSTMLYQKFIDKHPLGTIYVLSHPTPALLGN